MKANNLETNLPWLAPDHIEYKEPTKPFMTITQKDHQELLQVQQFGTNLKTLIPWLNICP
jgi:hypothetical protein